MREASSSCSPEGPMRMPDLHHGLVSRLDAVNAAPAARHRTDGRPRKVWMLFTLQVADQVRGGLGLGAAHTKSRH